MKNISNQQLVHLDPIVAAVMAAPAVDVPPAPPRPPAHPLEPQHWEFFHLVDQLIELNRRNRADYLGHALHMAPCQFAYRHCTVRVSAGRQSGATSYIRRHATKHDLVIVPSRKVRDVEYGPFGLPCRVVTAHEVERSQGLGRSRFAKIYIDSPTSVFGEVPQYRLFYELTHDTDQTFILLGD